MYSSLAAYFGMLVSVFVLDRDGREDECIINAVFIDELILGQSLAIRVRILHS